MKEIKIGDRVRFKKFCINHDEEIRVAEGDYGTVVFVDKIGIGVDLDVPQYVSVKATDVELADCDPKTAFLTELSELLRKYDAEIKSGAPGSEDSWINITSGGKGWITFDSNPDTFCATITPDNIFNYNKE